MNRSTTFPPQHNQRFWLWLEMLGVFMLAPMIVYLLISNLSDYLMPILFVVGFICLVLLLRDKQFNRERLLHWRVEPRHLLSCLVWFLPCALVMSLSVYWFAPDLLFSWPVENPELWLTTLFIYPLVSVLPQELIFRTYFFHRYKPVLPTHLGRWGVSTFLFGFAHLVYGNWIAVILSWFGGGLFGYRYLKTRSTLLVVAEHTLWGSFIFTVGFGSYLVMVK